MKSIMKRSLSLVLILILAFSMSIGAFAADSKPISVMLDGNKVEMKYAPVAVKGTTYVDYRSLLEAMGAKVDFDYRTNHISYDLNGETHVIKETLNTNDGPFVAVRTLAEELGYIISWDGSSNTVILMNIDNLLEQYKGKFTIMDKYMAYASEFAETNLSITGTMDINMKVTEGEETNDMSIKCKLDALSNKEVADMNVTMAMDVTNILKNADMDELDEMAKSMLKELGNTSYRMIYNMKDGVIYVQSKLISMMAGIPEDNWLSFDFNKLFETEGLNINMNSLMEMSYSSSFDEFLKDLVHSMPISTTEDAKMLIEGLGMMENFIGDKAFTKDGNKYINHFEFDEAGVKINADFVLDTKNDKVVGYSIDAGASAMDSEVFKLNAKQGTNDKITMKMNFNVPGILVADYDIVMDYKKTDKKPLEKPEDDSKIISINDMLDGLGLEL